MKILMIVEGFGVNRYGVEKAVENLAVYTIKNGIATDIITMVVDGPVNNQLKPNIYKVSYWGFTGQVRYHPKQYKNIYSLIKKISPTIVHCHGCLSWLQVSAIRAAVGVGSIKVITSSHGMLEPWLWRQKGKFYYLMKRFYWFLFLKPMIKKSDYVHVITEQESVTLKKEFPGIPQVIISNAIDINEYSSNQIQPDDDKYLLFIGRLHPVKAVDILVKSFQKVANQDFRLIIAGPDFDVEYTIELKSLVAELGLSESISFIGAVYGEQKSKLLRKAWCAIVPSYSEVIAMVNLESAASYTPTITTYATGLSDWEDGGGLLVEPEVKLLTEAINSVCNWSLEDRMERGRKSRKLVEQRYSWDVIGEQWIEAYKMIAESGTKHE